MRADEGLDLVRETVFFGNGQTVVHVADNVCSALHRRFAGVILNRLASDNHEKLIREAFDKLAIPVFGAIRRDEELKLSERHLGLVPTAEKDFAELAKIKKVVGQGVNLDMLLSVAKSAGILSALGHFVLLSNLA